MPGSDTNGHAGDGAMGRVGPVADAVADMAGGAPDEADGGLDEATGASSAMLSLLVLASRLTGFMRTWAQAMAIGVTPLASCYTVANNLPSQLYELVVGGMLVTAFLPVYMSVRREGGREAASRYASNLTGIVGALMGAVTVASVALASQVVWTQSFSASEGFDQATSAWFFRFFAIEMLLYSLSSIFSGILNAERDYAWSGAAPIANNVVTIASFLAYRWLVPTRPGLAMLALALGNPLGVLVQVLVQAPALRKVGVRIRPIIDLRDPALPETLAIGLPSLVTMACSFVTVSVQTSSALSATASGASVAAYARLWYTLPYAIFVVPITTTMFTELSDLYASGDRGGWAHGVAYGIGRILFVSTPLAFLLHAFSYRLVALIGPDFSAADTAMTAGYLQALAWALPPYGVAMYLQKVCSSARRMGAYAWANVAASVVQVAVCMWLTPRFGLPVVAYSTLAYMLVVDAVSITALRGDAGSLGLSAPAASFARGCACGAAGYAVARAALSLALGGLSAAPGSTVTAAAHCLAGGVPALAAVLVAAWAMRAPELGGVVGAVTRRLGLGGGRQAG